MKEKENNMYNMTHTLCINCFREETWNKEISWSDLQQHQRKCCGHPKRMFMTEYDDSFYCKHSVFQTALEILKEKIDRWTKNSKINRIMNWRIMEDLRSMGFIDAVYYDHILGYNIEYRWDDRTVVVNYPM